MLVRSLLFLGLCLVATTILNALPLDPDHQETLLNQLDPHEEDLLALESSNDVVVRDKRTIGFLRQAFPTLSQIIDRKIQAITRLLFRVIGRLVLRGGGGGGGGTSDSSDEDAGSRVQITLPTFPPSADDDEDEDEDSTGFSADDDSTPPTTEPSDEENAVAESKSVPVLVRKTRQAVAGDATSAEEEYEDDDQAVAGSEDNEVAQSAEDDVDDTDPAESEDDPRNKRFLNLGGSGSSGGGSGNFLFDIIRLVAGSGTTQSQDEADNAPIDDTNATSPGEHKAHDGYEAAVPGPLTRLFVIANRGIANLIQDLILRLAQTSERIVNFKARLITSII